MRKNILYLAAALALVSCEEFQPVFVEEYSHPDAYEWYEPAGREITSIANLAAKYTHGSPKDMALYGSGMMIAGRVISTDQPGNFYKSFYIQDNTGGIEIKVGKNGLYNDYLPGQMIYIECNDLFLGEYGYKSGSNYGNGMIQIGYDGTGTDYETSYLEVPMLIQTHVLRGDPSDLQVPEPLVLSENQLPGSSDTQATNSNVGRLVKICGLTYGGVNAWRENQGAFALLYLDSQKDKKSSSNRIFLSGDATHITTWAMSKSKVEENMASGIWDSVSIGNAGDYNYGTVGDRRGDGSYPTIEKAAASVSQYFTTGGGKLMCVRTSGYSKFADTEVPADVLDGSRKINVTGVLCLYQGTIQVVVNSLDDFEYADGTKMYN